MENQEKKPLPAARGVEAAHILFTLNTGTEDILRMAQRSGLPEIFWGGPLAPALCGEWRAFVHAAVTAGLMQHAPNSVLTAYLRDTGFLLEQAEGHADAVPHTTRVEEFVDGPFSAYMELMAQERQKECPLLFFRRLGISGEGEASHLMDGDALARAQGRIAAVMAMLISAIQDKLDAYDIAAD